VGLGTRPFDTILQTMRILLLTATFSVVGGTLAACGTSNAADGGTGGGTTYTLSITDYLSWCSVTENGAAFSARIVCRGHGRKPQRRPAQRLRLGLLDRYRQRSRLARHEHDRDRYHEQQQDRFRVLPLPSQPNLPLGTVRNQRNRQCGEAPAAIAFDAAARGAPLEQASSAAVPSGEPG
jgi:hypothetical protein